MSSEPPQSDVVAIATDEPVRFRPGKKRKVYRQRTDTSPAPAASTASPATAHDNPSDDEDERTSAAAALRLRNARKTRTGGIGFSAAGSNLDSSGDPTGSAQVVSRAGQDGESAVVQGVTNRFTHQTGLVSSLNDKHMTEYIESRLSRRAEPTTSSRIDDARPSDSQNSNSAARLVTTAVATKPSAVDPTVEQPTRQGRLMEVDLSEVPVRKPPKQHQGLAPAPKKQRLGPDGKPWRGRKRRASDDVKRDELVEAILHENRLDVYDTTQPDTAISGLARDGDVDGTTADDRLAEQFQRQYMDDMARRRQRKKPAQATAATGQGEDVLKGPKLGGSRNARAAVRDALLKKEKEGRK